MSELNKVKIMFVRLFSLMMIICFFTLQKTEAKKYFIDFSSGNDTRSGVTKDLSWKYCPGMNGATGKSKSHVWASGDTFIFRGGVTWDSSAFQFVLNPNQLYDGSGYSFTIDSTWYKGNLFSRPVFDVMEKQINPVVKIWYKDSITFNGFEVKNSKGLAGQGNATVFGCYDLNCGWFTNLWVHSTHANGVKGTNDGPINCNACSSITIIGNVFVGSDSGLSGVATSGIGYKYIIKYNTISHVNAGLMLAGGCENSEIAYNDISNIYQGTYDPGAHTNGIFVFGKGSGFIHHNKIYDVNTMCLWQNGGNWKVYNNIVYNSNGSQAANWENEDVACPACSLEFFNNYIEGHFIVTNRKKSMGYIEIRNNVMNGIQINDTINKIVLGKNLYKKSALDEYLTVLGVNYTKAQAARFNDDSSKFEVNPLLNKTGEPVHINSPVINTGSNLSNRAYPHINKDFKQKNRSTKDSWSIGAYEPDPDLIGITPKGLSGIGVISEKK